MTPTPDYQMFLDIQNGQVSFEEFMSWLASERTRAHSNGYKDGSENAYRNGGGFEF